MEYKNIYRLKGNADLLPGKGVIPAGKEISGLHCIKKPTENVIIRFLGGEKSEFPPNAFVPGAIYPYSIRQISPSGEDCFYALR